MFMISCSFITILPNKQEIKPFPLFFDFFGIVKPAMRPRFAGGGCAAPASSLALDRLLDRETRVQK